VWSRSARLGLFAAAQPCRECPIADANTTGLNLLVPPPRRELRHLCVFDCLLTPFVEIVGCLRSPSRALFGLCKFDGTESHQGAGAAQFQRAHTGSSLPPILGGRSHPCLGAASASGRSRSVCLVAGGEALCRAAAPGWDRSQQHNHAVSAQLGAPTKRGLILLMPSPRLELRHLCVFEYVFAPLLAVVGLARSQLPFSWWAGQPRVFRIY